MFIISIEYFNGHKEENINNFPTSIKTLSSLTEKFNEQNDMELTHSSNDSSHNEKTLLTSPVSNNMGASTSSLQKAPVYAKIVKSK